MNKLTFKFGAVFYNGAQKFDDLFEICDVFITRLNVQFSTKPKHPLQCRRLEIMFILK